MRIESAGVSGGVFGIDSECHSEGLRLRLDAMARDLDVIGLSLAAAHLQMAIDLLESANENCRSIDFQRDGHPH